MAWADACRFSQLRPRAWHIGRSNSNPFRRRFNVLPTTSIPILRGNPASRELELVEARWGFIPHWWKLAKPPQHCFNARSEEAAGKPMWRHSYRHARCLIPAQGWYEWEVVERTDPRTGEVRTYKQPHFIYRQDKKLICVAGVMAMHMPEGKDPLLTCALLTRDATPSVADVHDRMPVILDTPLFGRWLDPGVQKAEDVKAIVARATTKFEHYPVSTKLNTAKKDDESLIVPVR